MEPHFAATSLPKVFRESLAKAAEVREPLRPSLPRQAATASSTHRRSSGVPPNQSHLVSPRAFEAPFGTQPRKPKPQATASIDPRDEAGILFPYNNIADDDGSLQQIMWAKWNHDATNDSQAASAKDAFVSFALYAQVKLQEAQRMAAYLEQPNLFVTAVASSLLQRCADRLGASGGIVRQLLQVLLSAIYHRKDADVTPARLNVDRYAPYFAEYRRLRRTCVDLLEENTRKHNETAARKQGFGKIQRVIQGTTRIWKHRLLHFLYFQWAYYVFRRRRIRRFVDRTFRHKNRGSVRDTFRAWRIEALRRAYYRESANYQTMLSVTAESLSRKDVQLTSATEKIAKLQMHVDQLTTTNSNLITRVQDLESQIRILKLTMRGSLTAPAAQDHPPLVSAMTAPPAAYERMDTIVYEDDQPRDDGGGARVNKMLLEGMFAMARMVESAVIQFSKESLEALETQYDGAELRQLSQRIADEHAQIDKITTGYHDVHLTNVLSKPVDTILLHWARMKLEESKIVLRPQDRMLKNFTDDLADGSKFSTLLHHLFPRDYDTHMVHEINVEQRLANIERFNKTLRVESSSDVKVPVIVTADSIAAQRGLENAVFISVLFTLSPGHFSKVNTEKCRKVFLQIVSAWKKVRSLMLEVKRTPDDPLGAENMMVVTLGKEMRRVEELHTLLQKEMTSLVCASNESAGVLSKLLHKILCFTWRMLSQRDRGVDGDIIDERRADTLRKFTSVSANVIRRLISDEPSPRRRSISDTEVMTRVFGIQKVLKHHFNDLHAIFRHYSCSTLRGHSATMSLQEYIKFVKDCNIVDKKVHLPVVDAIYHHCVEAQDDGTAQREMSPMDFVHALVLVADKKFPSMVFEERIQELLDKCVLPNASRSQPEAFRLLLHSPEVRAVLLKFKSPLQHVFKYYSNMKTDDV
ncbi:hypothetical protein SDRG_05962 [Saprolegnia diclina VS20]|uniref:Calponin-homology (CH) domain-containing protein n=1 Tax=Saprolegnia diclina (strain VS20) TaxID=1156394 RepID=T0QP70_SAPDV|nr:hypothetical protein SDRG_05962 [Saprolegnia diclina VS20]EQC36511.1 hypothetical protein SDRG_05962 [Saprolegnia diclina VS20]|eukprot:XP_008609932.1 hypothetical protein SDRG_05962 [Saprolegnia diclina VS20]